VYYPQTYGYLTGIDKNGNFFMIPYSTGPKTVVEKHCYPATPGSPGVPGTFVPGTPGIPPVPPKPADYNPGWNASARSIDSLTGNGTYQFSVSPDAVGVVTGLNDVNNGSAYVEIDYAIYCATGRFEVMEGGASVGVSGGFTLADTFAIVRVGNAVQYFQNTTLLYTSKKPSTGMLFADSSLYFGGDQITSASLSPTVDSALPLPGVTGALTGTLDGLRGYFSDTGQHGRRLPRGRQPDRAVDRCYGQHARGVRHRRRLGAAGGDGRHGVLLRVGPAAAVVRRRRSHAADDERLRHRAGGHDRRADRWAGQPARLHVQRPARWLPATRRSATAEARFQC
jgi:hypothetical protein